MSKKRKLDVVDDGEKVAVIKELTGSKRKNKLLAHNPDLERAQNFPEKEENSVPEEKSKKRKKESKSEEKKRVHVVEPTNVVEVVYDDSAPQDMETREEVQETPATDSEWLRARTSRTLGLVSDSEQSEDDANEQSDDEMSDDDKPEVANLETTPVTPPATDPSDTEQPPSSKPSTPESKILKTGRLFIRNLVYGVTEDDLRNIFSPYGEIEEVSLPRLSPMHIKRI